MTKKLTDERLRRVVDGKFICSDSHREMARELLELRKLCAEREEKLAFMADRLGDANGKRDKAQAEVKRLQEREAYLERERGAAKTRIEYLTKQRDDTVRELEVMRMARDAQKERADQAEINQGKAEQNAENLRQNWLHARKERDKTHDELEQAHIRIDALRDRLSIVDRAAGEWEANCEEAMTDAEKAREPFGTPTITRDQDGNYVVGFGPSIGYHVLDGRSRRTLEHAYAVGIAAKALLDHLETEKANPSLKEAIKRVADAFDDDSEYTSDADRDARQRLYAALDAGVFDNLEASA